MLGHLVLDPRLLIGGLSLVMIALAVWIYRHCARPALAFAGAPPIAFDLVLVSLFGTIAVCSVLLLDVVAEVPHGLSRFMLTTEVFFYVTLGLAFFRPGWFVRLGAGRDATAPVRFLLTWMGKEWAKLDAPERDGARLVGVVVRELERMRDPSNALLVDEWIVLLGTYLRKSGSGRMSAESARRDLVARLRQVRPVDRLVPIF